MPGGGGHEGGGHSPLPVRPVEFEGRQIDWEEYLHLPGVYPRPDPHQPLHVPMFVHYMNLMPSLGSRSGPLCVAPGDPLT